MYIAMNRFRIAHGREDVFEELWRKRDSQLDGVPGFLEFHLLKGPSDDTGTLYSSHTQWESRAAFEAWTKSESFVKAHALSSGRLGVTGFCWGGSTTNYLATALGPDMHAGVPFYGAAAETASVPKIKAPLLIQLAENDERINSTYPAYESALKAAGVPYEIHSYPGTQHGFHNNSTPRYDERAATLSWQRTIAFLKKQLA